MDLNSGTVTVEEYGIYLVNSINAGGYDLDRSTELAKEEIDRLLKVLGTIKGMSKISKISFFKKVRKYLDDM